MSERRVARLNGVEVEVDPRLCAGSRWCLNAAPGAFETDAFGKAMPLDEMSATHAQLLEAEESCPVGAIRVSIADDQNLE